VFTLEKLHSKFNADTSGCALQNLEANEKRERERDVVNKSEGLE